MMMRLAVAIALGLAAVPVAAQEVGVLLGLRSGRAYRSLWLVFGPTTTALAADVNTLLVPRRNGFWKVSVATASAGTKQHIQEDALRAWPIDQPPPSAPAVSADEIHDCEATNERESLSDITVLFAGPDYVSWRRDWNSDCGVYPDGGTSLRVASVDDPQKPLTIDALLGPSIIRLFQAAAAEKLLQIPAADRDCFAGADAFDWAITRGPSAWQIVGHIGPAANICRNADEEFPVAALLSPKVVGFSEPVGPRSAATDALVAARSPQGPHAVLVARNGQVSASRDGVEYVPISLDSPEAVDSLVVIQWAFGTHVARWTEAIRHAMQARGRPTKG